MLHFFYFFGGHDKPLVSKVLKAPREFAFLSKIILYVHECVISVTI